MKLTFESDNRTYTTLRNLTFAPEVDLTGQTLPINEFTVDIETHYPIRTNQFARLTDDSDNVWARYWVIKVKKKATRLYTVLAQSILVILNDITMPAALISDTLGGAIDKCFDGVADVVGSTEGFCVIDPSITNTQVYGFAPEQSARDRVQSLLMATGSYIKTWNDTKSRVLPIPDFVNFANKFGEVIQSNRIFWKPKLAEQDNITTLRLSYYDVATYDNGGQEVKDYYNNSIWVLEHRSGQIYPGNGKEVAISGNMLVSYASYQSILPTFARTYVYSNNHVEADFINNGELWPGDRISFQYDETGRECATGYIKSVTFSFGHQSRSKIDLYPSQVNQSSTLRMDWTYNGRVVYSETRVYPWKYDYSIELPNQQVLANGHLYVYSPVVDFIQGELNSDDKVEVIECYPISDTNLITGDVITDFTPHHITITTPPKRLSYTTGNDIEYSGIVVKVFNASNQLMDTYTTPNGIIAYKDLVMSITTADIDAGTLDIPVEWTAFDGFTIFEDTFDITVYAIKTESSEDILVARGTLVDVSGTKMVFTDKRAVLDGNMLIVGE